MAITLITKRDLQGENPLFPSSQYYDDFILMNMNSQGIWLVDKKIENFEAIKNTALDVARTFGDKETIEKLTNLK